MFFVFEKVVLVFGKNCLCIPKKWDSRDNFISLFVCYESRPKKEKENSHPSRHTLIDSQLHEHENSLSPPLFRRRMNAVLVTTIELLHAWKKY